MYCLPSFLSPYHLFIPFHVPLHSHDIIASLLFCHLILCFSLFMAHFIVITFIVSLLFCHLFICFSLCMSLFILIILLPPFFYVTLSFISFIVFLFIIITCIVSLLFCHIILCFSLFITPSAMLCIHVHPAFHPLHQTRGSINILV